MVEPNLTHQGDCGPFCTAGTHSPPALAQPRMITQVEAKRETATCLKGGGLRPCNPVSFQIRDPNEPRGSGMLFIHSPYLNRTDESLSRWKVPFPRLHLCLNVFSIRVDCICDVWFRLSSVSHPYTEALGLFRCNPYQHFCKGVSQRFIYVTGSDDHSRITRLQLLRLCSTITYLHCKMKLVHSPHRSISSDLLV